MEAGRGWGGGGGGASASEHREESEDPEKNFEIWRLGNIIFSILIRSVLPKKKSVLVKCMHVATALFLLNIAVKKAMLYKMRG